jgi:transcriptional regulator with XRE-family HTH domain
MQARRAELKLSQGALGKIIGVTQGAVSKWETGDRNMSPEHATAVESWLQRTAPASAAPPQVAQGDSKRTERRLSFSAAEIISEAKGGAGAAGAAGAAARSSAEAARSTADAAPSPAKQTSSVARSDFFRRMFGS